MVLKFLKSLTPSHPSVGDSSPDKIDLSSLNGKGFPSIANFIHALLDMFGPHGVQLEPLISSLTSANLQIYCDYGLISHSLTFRSESSIPVMRVADQYSGRSWDVHLKPLLRAAIPLLSGLTLKTDADSLVAHSRGVVFSCLESLMHRIAVPIDGAFVISMDDLDLQLAQKVFVPERKSHVFSYAFVDEDTN